MKRKALFTALVLCVALSSCSAQIKLQQAQSDSAFQQSDYLRPEPLQFYMQANGELRIGIGANARVGLYERDIKAPIENNFSNIISTQYLNAGGDFPQSYSGFACKDKLAFLNANGGEAFKIKISDDGGDSWYEGEIERDLGFIQASLGYESHIGFTTPLDGYLALNSDTSSLSAASNTVTRLYFTSDGGKTWYRGNSPPDLQGLKIAGAFFETPTIGTIFYHDAFAFEGTAQVRKTTDGGASWQRQELIIEGHSFGASFDSFRILPPQYVQSKVLKNKGEWVLPVRSLFAENAFDLDALTAQEVAVLQEMDAFKNLNTELDKNSYYVEYPYFCRDGTWAVTADAYISPNLAPLISAKNSYTAIVQMDKTTKAYMNKSIKTTQNELLAYEPMPDYTDKIVLSLIPHASKLSYYITNDDVLLLYENTNIFVSNDIFLILKQTQDTFEAIGLQIAGEGNLVD